MWIAVGMGGIVLVGFWFTYFGPMYDGVYPQVSPLVHVHGWSFFVWYALLGLQAGLVRTRRMKVHRGIGLATIVLGAIMILTGLIVTTVRIDMGMGPDGDPFWAFMGVPIFSIWLLFTGFYVAGIYRRKRSGDHKRLILLASAAALSAATFRIVVQIFGFEPWVAIVGMYAPLVFVAASMIHDYATTRQIHRVYRWSVPTVIGLIAGAFLVVMRPEGEPVIEALAWVGRLLLPLY